MKKRNLPAFTIIELVVVMILSSIILGMAFTAVRSIQQSYELYDQQTQAALDISDFQTLLNTDFENSKLASCANTTLFLTFEQHDLQYQFDYDWVIRQTAYFSDTFFIENNTPTFYYQNQPISIGNIDFLEVKSTNEEEEVVFYFEKKYSSTELWEEIDN